MNVATGGVNRVAYATRFAEPVEVGALKPFRPGDGMSEEGLLRGFYCDSISGK